MDKIKTRFRNLSLRASLVLYVVLMTMAALALIQGTEAVCSYAIERLYASYPSQREKYYLTSENGERLGEGTYIYKTPLSLTEEDERLLSFANGLPLVAAPVYSALCILAAAFLFYRNRLRKPLAELKRASEKISVSDLNFSLSYDRKDELGELCASFETMRSQLEDSFSGMWRQMEERRRLNAAFAHDLRTPLTVLKGYDELLQAGEDSQVRSVAVTMGKHIARMERYVDSMSQLQRLEDRQPEYQRISLSELLTQIEENANIICRENDKKICLRNQAVSGHFRLDGMFLSQVCGNLVANAARYADTQVTLILEERDGGLALTVADDGPGFNGKMLREAWNPYVTGEERREEHFGLGLYICRLLSERHGGWLKVENGTSGAKVTAFFKNGPESR